MTQLHQNDRELEAGVSSAEFNLRAHQKAINDLALTVEMLVNNDNLANAAAGSPNPNITGLVEMADVPIPQEDGTEKIYRRIHWGMYHARVEYDLKLLAEAAALEKKAKEEEAAAEAGPPQEGGSDIPEGAVVFGGDKK